TEEGQWTAMSFDVGLALAGDAAAADRVRSAIRPDPDPKKDAEGPGIQWALGLSTRLAHRDASVLGTIVDLWRRGGRVIRLQIGMSVLLADPAPPPLLPCDAFADALAADAGSRTSRAVGHSWKY